MPSVGFEPTISAGERPQIYVLDRAATGTGILFDIFVKNIIVDPPIVWEMKHYTESRSEQGLAFKIRY